MPAKWRVKTEKMIVDKVAQMHSLRKEVFSREANGKLKWALRSGRFGPFTEEFVLIQVLCEKEDVNRLVAELVLLRHKSC